MSPARLAFFLDVPVSEALLAPFRMLRTESLVVASGIPVLLPQGTLTLNTMEITMVQHILGFPRAP